MGCHTWTYTKLEPQPTWEDIKKNVIEQFEDEVSFGEQLMNDRESINPKLLEAYPEWNYEFGQRLKDINERRLRLVKNDRCKEACYNRYDTKDFSYNYANGIYYVKVRGFHDMFRRNGYPNDKLFSLQETLDYINNKDNNCTVYEDTIELLEAFWSTCPNGMIDFG